MSENSFSQKKSDEPAWDQIHEGWTIWSQQIKATWAPASHISENSICVVLIKDTPRHPVPWTASSEWKCSRICKKIKQFLGIPAQTHFLLSSFPVEMPLCSPFYPSDLRLARMNEPVGRQRLR